MRSSPPPALDARETERRRILANMRRDRKEIAQIFLDIAYWNKHCRPPGCPPIDPDPVGELARWDENLCDQIMRMGEATP